MAKKRAKSSKKAGRAKKAATQKEEKEALLGEEAVKPEQKPGQKEALEKPEKSALEKAFAAVQRQKGLAILAVIALIAIIGSATYMLAPMPSVSIGDFFKPGAGDTVNAILVYSDECPGCHIMNSLQILFVENDIKYAINAYEANSEDGKRLLEALQGENAVKKLPVWIINGSTIMPNMLVKTKQAGLQPLKEVLKYYASTNPLVVYNRENDIFILPEIGMDSRAHINTLLGESCGSAEKPRVDILTDPYSPPYIAAFPQVHEVRKKFADAVEFSYDFLPVDSNMLYRRFDRDYVNEFADNLVCAEDESENTYMLLESELYKIYCGSDDSNSLDAAEIADCSTSGHFGIPLGADEIYPVAERLHLHSFSFNLCISATELRYAATRAFAEKYGIFQVPTAVVNCKYETHVTNVENAICVANPDLNACTG